MVVTSQLPHDLTSQFEGYIFIKAGATQDPVSHLCHVHAFADKHDLGAGDFINEARKCVLCGINVEVLRRR